MSRTNRGDKGPGYEYWSRRPGLRYELGSSAKQRTAKAERRQAKQEIEELVRDSQEPCSCHLCDNPARHKPGDECYWELPL